MTVPSWKITLSFAGLAVVRTWLACFGTMHLKRHGCQIHADGLRQPKRRNNEEKVPPIDRNAKRFFALCAHHNKRWRLVCWIALSMLFGSVAPAAPSPPLDSKSLEQMMLKFNGEPTIAQVHERVITATRTHGERVRSWESRVRNAPWLPKLSVRFGQDKDADRSLEQEVGDPDKTKTSNSSQWKWHMQTDWLLNQLVFSPDELKVAQTSTNLWELRQKTLKQVTETYFARRKVQLTLLLSPSLDQQERLEQHMRIATLTTEIDRMTDDWFSRQIHQ